MMELPLVTVVTITYNLIKGGRENNVRQSIESVLNQTYKNVEHIIIDGASSDGTLEIFNDYPHLKVYSEPDKGIYDAMNKGVAKASGKYIAFLNSDDFWHDNRAIELSVNALEENQADFSFAPCTYLDKNDEIEGYSWPAIESFFARVPFCHQSMFTKTELVNFNLQYKVLADFDLFIRLFLSGYYGVCVPDKFLSFRHTGLSSSSNNEYGNQGYVLTMQDIHDILINNLSKYGLKEKDIKPLHFDGKIKRTVLEKIVKDVHPDLSKSIKKHFLSQQGKFIKMDILAGMRKVQILFNARDLTSPEAERILADILKHKDCDVFLYVEPDVIIPNKFKKFPLYDGRIREIDAFCSPISQVPQRIKNSNVPIYTSEKDIVFHPVDDLNNIFIKGKYKVKIANFTLFSVSVNHGIIKYSLFKILPIYKIVSSNGKDVHYLFNFLKVKTKKN